MLQCRRLQISLQKFPVPVFIHNDPIIGDHLLQRTAPLLSELPRRRGTERKIRLELLPASEVVIPDLEAAENDYYQAKFGNFTEEEIRQYTLLERKVRENERSILQRG